MITPNEYPDPTVPKPAISKRVKSFGGEHWSEMTATLSPEATEPLADWIDSDLAEFEARWSQFVTAESRKQSSRR
jgi:hypothetical protein